MKKLLFNISRSNYRQVIFATVTFLFTLITINADGQNIINAGPDQSIACGSSTTLTATITPTQSTTSYTISNIPFSPDPFNQGTLVSLGDDQNTVSPIAIGFPFCFYGNTYTNFYISSNNWIGFSSGQTSTWVTTTIPNASGAAPRNCIMAPWQDIHPGLGGQIRYAVYGTAPFRRLVVTYFNIPMYSCTGMLYTSQIKIYETTNVIETHISNKPLCTGWNGGKAVHGLHNANGTQATVVTGRNNTQWNTANEGTRFTPSGAANYTVEWLDANNTVIGSGTNLNITPNATSTYTARVSYNCGNQQYSDQVQVNLPIVPTPAFSLSNSVVCEGDVVTVTYNGNATPAANYTWNFNGATIISGSGQGPYQIQWPTAGTYGVTLSVSENGCSSATGGLPVTVNALPTGTFTFPASVCNPDTVAISYTGNGLSSATYTWNFDGANVVSGSGQGPYQLYWPTTGAKNVNLTVAQNGCTSTLVANTVNVYQTPTANFTAVSGVCENTATSITYNGNATPAATYNWNFNGGTVVSGNGQGPYQVSWPTFGTYNVSLSVSENGCNSTTVTNPVLVNDIPVASFSMPISMCMDNTAPIAFNGNGQVNANYTWNFNGGTVVSGSGQGPYTIAWNTPGTKTVSLVITQNGCTSNTFSANIDVFAVPTANFTVASSVCEDTDLPVTYTGTGSANATYNWSFDANSQITSGNGQGPYQVQWTAAGAYNVSLTVTENGCISVPVSQAVTIYQQPTSSFTVISPVCQNQPSTIVYNGNASNTANFGWNFDNGTVQSGSGNGPYYVVWSVPGTKNITLTVSENGCVSTQTTEQVVVDTVPTVDAGLDATICSGQSVQIGRAGTVGFTYSWSPATGLDDPTSSMPTATLTNNTTAPIIVAYVLTANNNGLCNSYDTVLVTVNPIPVVSFAVPAGQCLDNNNFTFTPTGNYSNNAQFDWVIDSVQNTSLLPNTLYQSFTTAGTHTVSVTVTDGACVSAPFTATVEVYAMPVANFTGTGVEGCIPFKAQFNNLSTGNIASYSWDLGAGISTDENPFFIYNAEGNFDITLTVTSVEGCVSAMTIPAYVLAHPVPKAGFVATPETVDIVLNPYVDITDMSNGADTYFYDFGNTDNSTIANPQTSYRDTGSYVIKQVVTNQFGCKDSTTRTVVALPSHTFYIPTAFTPNEDGLNDTFKPQGFEIDNYTMNIYNRWGQLVYSTTDINAGWDGNFNNEKCVPSVYTWRITYESKAMKSDGRQVKEGMVTLLR